jgi:hypothetical protein
VRKHSGDEENAEVDRDAPGDRPGGDPRQVHFAEADAAERWEQLTAFLH